MTIPQRGKIDGRGRVVVGASLGALGAPLGLRLWGRNNGAIRTVLKTKGLLRRLNHGRAHTQISLTGRQFDLLSQMIPVCSASGKLLSRSDPNLTLHSLCPLDANVCKPPANYRLTRQHPHYTECSGVL